MHLELYLNMYVYFSLQEFSEGFEFHAYWSIITAATYT
jgi:hypothetical protein